MSAVKSEWLKEVLKEASDKAAQFPGWLRGSDKPKTPPSAGSVSGSGAEPEPAKPETEGSTPAEK